MTEPADRIFTNAAVHTLAADDTAEAVAVRDGTIVRVDSAYEVGFLDGATTDVVDLGGRILLPGFVDAHTHLELTGRRAREADLGGADSPEDCLSSLETRAATTTGWILGFGYDESAWDGEYLTRDQLDTVSTDRPVAAFREDMHVASVNSVVLERHRGTLPAGDVRTDDGEPTGVLVEGAVSVLNEAIRPDREQVREYLLTAQAHANERGVTAVHEMVRHSTSPRVYRDLALAGELTLRVRLNYWADHLDAVLEAGLATNHGGERVQMGGIKTYTDGSLGGRTARLREPYADADTRGDWVTDPADLAALVERVDDAGLQFAAHAIGDEAIGAVLDALSGTDGDRHRIEHAEVLTGDLVDRLATAEVIVSAQPNFLKWADEGGLYDARLGPERRRATNRFRDLVDAGATLAFGSDCLPLDPLVGIDNVVNAPEPAQQLDVTEALQAYTVGGAYAGFDGADLGTIERGKRADLVALEASPWETDAIADIDVALTAVGGDIVYDGR
ncbi:MAG: amidohydrolase [Haloarculaceae archaeon]